MQQMHRQSCCARLSFDIDGVFSPSETRCRCYTRRCVNKASRWRKVPCLKEATVPFWNTGLKIADQCMSPLHSQGDRKKTSGFFVHQSSGRVLLLLLLCFTSQINISSTAFSLHFDELEETEAFSLLLTQNPAAQQLLPERNSLPHVRSSPR